MAKNLAQKTAGSLFVYDLNTAAVDRFLQLHPNAQRASSPAHLAENAATVITMLPEAQHVENVYASLIQAVDKDSILIDSSTIDAATAVKVAETIKAKDAEAFDAPVSGGMLTKRKRKKKNGY